MNTLCAGYSAREQRLTKKFTQGSSASLARGRAWRRTISQMVQFSSFCITKNKHSPFWFWAKNNRNNYQAERCKMSADQGKNVNTPRVETFLARKESCCPLQWLMVENELSLNPAVFCWSHLLSLDPCRHRCWERLSGNRS